MSHRTFRSLDEPPKLIGFSIRQWAALICGGLALLGLVQLAALPTKAAITLAVFTARAARRADVRLGGRWPSHRGAAA